MTTKKNPSAVKKAPPKKPAAKTTKTSAASGKPRSKEQPKTGFLKTARVAVGEVVQTIAEGAVHGVATAAKGLLEKQIGSTSKTKNPAAKKNATGTTGKKAASSTAKRSTTTRRSASKSSN